MKRALLCLVLSALPVKAGLWEAVCAVESSGNPHAVGDGGKAVGIAQIHPIMVREANRLAGTKYTLKDRLDPVKSKAIFTIYTEHYGKGRSVEYQAKLWNGGPSALKAKGQKRINLENYWRKIQSKL
jgi:soluble lytic murein transglycosylase-like protein